MFNGIGTTEIIIIAVLLLIFFGGKKFTELARGLGQSGKELKNVKKEFQNALKEADSDDLTKPKETGKEV